MRELPILQYHSFDEALSIFRQVTISMAIAEEVRTGNWSLEMHTLCTHIFGLSLSNLSPSPGTAV